MSADNFTGQFISSTFQRLLQLSDNGNGITDGTGSIVTILPTTASYSLTASYLLGNATSTPTFPYTGSAIISGSLIVTGSIYATNGFTGSVYGTSSWAINAQTASYAIQSSDIILTVLNQTGTQINKGAVVRVTGSNNASDIPRIALADYINDNLSANTLGLATANIANGAIGTVLTEGIFTGYDTSTPGWVSGQLVYLGQNGAITGSAPLAPLHAVRLGQVIRVQSNNGSIYVRIDNGYELNELHDVQTTTATDGDLLIRSGSVWINSKSLSGNYAITGSFIQGLGSTTPGQYSHAEGNNTKAIGYASHAEGNNTRTGTVNAYYADISTISFTTLTLSNSYGDKTSYFTPNNELLISDEFFTDYVGRTIRTISQSYYDGTNTILTINGSLPTGVTQAIVGNLTANPLIWDGDQTLPSNYSHTEGYLTLTLGNYAHAEGENAIALSNFSHAEGLWTIAQGNYQHVQGKYNIPNTNEAAFIVGNGTNNISRSNLINAYNNTVELNGTVNISGSLSVNNNVIDQTYKVYSALVTQTGGSAPSATVLENSTNETFTYKYNSNGNYTLNKTGLEFNNTKTAFIHSANSAYWLVSVVSNGTNDILLQTSPYNDNASTADDLLNGFIEVRIYN